MHRDCICSRRLATPLAVFVLAVAAILMLGGGCDEDETCPACPRPGIVIEQIYTLPDSTRIGGEVNLWAIAEGEDLSYRWVASSGEFKVIDTYYALWKAPDSPTISEITVVAYNDEESAARTQAIVVGSYRPRHEPTYAGASYCGLECHGVLGHGSNYDTWVSTRHAAAFDGMNASPYAGDVCAGCHAVGAWDADSSGWPRHNGGYDELPIGRLEGVQCESCHGPLSDRRGEILPDHAARAAGEFLLAVGTSANPVGCGRCHERYTRYPHHDAGNGLMTQWEASRHAASATDPASHEPGCARCHTAQGFIVRMEGGDALPAAPADPLPIVCAACHDPHGSTHPAALRAGYEDDVCSRCHSDVGGGYPDPPHAPQAQMLAAEGGYEYGGIGDSSPHANVAQQGCATCHFPPGGDGPHSFAADPASCSACHPDAGGPGFSWSGEMVVIGRLLAALDDELARATPADRATEAYRRAQFNRSFVGSDGSSGAHNYEYARALLNASLADFEPSADR